MNPKQIAPKLSLRALLLGAALLAFQAASGCGKVASSEDTGSETHWLVRCESDAECGPRRCECGVCTKSCTEDANCSELGVPDTRCASVNQCTLEAPIENGRGSVCLLPCGNDADCAALGSQASCQRGRCEAPQRNAGISAGGADNTPMGNTPTGFGGSSPYVDSIPESAAGGAAGDDVSTLCDGSEDVRFVLWYGEGFVSSLERSAHSYGGTFIVVDGRCRYWYGGNYGIVFSGRLTDVNARKFARRLGYGHLAGYSEVKEERTCEPMGARTIWTPEGSLYCTCQCGDATTGLPEPWKVAFIEAEGAVDSLFERRGEVTGPAQLLLLATSQDPLDPVPWSPEPWPLERSPTAAEMLPEGSYVDESSGVRIEEATELAALRATRNNGQGTNGYGYMYSLVTWTDPATQSPQLFYLLLRDDVPPIVHRALEDAIARIKARGLLTESP